MAKRRETICYPEFLARGWQIGSRPTEAMCKMTTARLKGSGMRWEGLTRKLSWGYPRWNRVTEGSGTGKVA